MPLSASNEAPAARGPIRLRAWNRRIHFYLGLFLLLFIWLFSVTGLLLNTSTWTFAEFWPDRRESSFQRPVRPPTATADLAMAHEVMAQLEVAGEVSQTERSGDSREFEFRVNRPGRMLEVQVDWTTRVATVKEVRVNAWGIANTLHTFTGVPRRGEPDWQRDWILTRLWSLSIDAVSVGLIVLVLTGVYLWYRLPRKRIPGAIALVAGLATCGFFLFGLS